MAAQRVEAGPPGLVDRQPTPYFWDVSSEFDPLPMDANSTQYAWLGADNDHLSRTVRDDGVSPSASVIALDRYGPRGRDLMYSFFKRVYDDGGSITRFEFEFPEPEAGSLWGPDQPSSNYEVATHYLQNRSGKFDVNGRQTASREHLLYAVSETPSGKVLRELGGRAAHVEWTGGGNLRGHFEFDPIETQRRLAGLQPREVFPAPGWGLLPQGPELPKLPEYAGPSHYFGAPVTLLNGPFALYEGLEGAGGPRVFRDVSGDLQGKYGGVRFGRQPDNTEAYRSATYLDWDTGTPTYLPYPWVPGARGKGAGEIVANDPLLRAQGVTGRALIYSGFKHSASFGGGYQEFMFSFGRNTDHPELSLNFKVYADLLASGKTSEESLFGTPSGKALWELGLTKVKILGESSSLVRGYFHSDGRFSTFRPYQFEQNWTSLTELNRILERQREGK
jgi:hypothetical protein